MRSTTRTAVLSCSVAGALLLAGCSSSGSDSAGGQTSPPAGPTSSSAAAATPSATASGDPEALAFCAQAQQAGADLNQAFTAAGNDQSKLPGLLQQSVDSFSAITPPAAVADDWKALVGGLQQLSDATASIDLTAPDATAQLQAALAGVQGPLTTAQNDIQTYVQQQCGAPSAATGSASPTS